ncbi:glycosyltransferase family 39 protein [Aggregatilinea lenta]|uniref:glycosyltransferase family 39 protein n=1 Tax=Aggregatilinea lenta TaxID=913108 RepID=UPI000E5A70A6|nr:glycosyltransferase family 39 protein [Aggregatilinea lenta]
MSTAAKPSLKLVILLALFAVGVIVHQSALPVMEGNDEVLHTNYLIWLRANGTLPDRTGYLTNSTRQESGQPPLAYWVAARCLDLLDLPRPNIDLLTELSPVRNRWFTPPDRWNRRDNFNQYFHGPGEAAFDNPDIVHINRAARWLSLAYGLIAVAGMYRLAREFFRRERWALLATAFFAFMPQMLYMCAMFSNDSSATAFATLALWQTMVLLRRGASPLRLVIIGALVGLAGLSKVSALLILPGIALAVLIDGRNRYLPIWRVIVNWLLLGAAIALVFGPWVVYGWRTFDDPFGLRTHGEAADSPSVVEVIEAVPELYLSYWAKFGSASIWITPGVYVLFTLTAALSLWGYVRVFRRFGWRSLAGQRILVSVVLVIPALAALLYWLVKLFPVAFAITGRLIYFVHGPIIAALVGGLLCLSDHLPVRLRLPLRIATLGPVMLAGLLLAPVVVWSSYAPPKMLARDDLPALKGPTVDYNQTIRFLGYVDDDPRIYDNTLHRVTLCWEVLRPTTETAMFSFKIFDDTGAEVGGRTSVHGMGHYSASLWEAGDIFCDPVDVPVEGPLDPAQTYDARLVIFDTQADYQWQATTPEGDALDDPVIYQLVSPARDMSGSVEMALQASDITFPDLARVEGWAVDGTPGSGQTFNLTLLWDAKSAAPGDWSMFVHLIGPSTALSLAGSPPRDGAYPTWAWSPGEKIVDTWQIELPADLPPGSYEVRIGFFDAMLNQRLPAQQVGEPVADGDPRLFTFTVD